MSIRYVYTVQAMPCLTILRMIRDSRLWNDDLNIQWTGKNNMEFLNPVLDMDNNSIHINISPSVYIFFDLIRGKLINLGS